MGEYKYPLRFIALGVLLTGLGAWMLLTFDTKDPLMADVRSMGWPFLIAGPAVLVLGIFLLPRDCP